MITKKRVDIAGAIGAHEDPPGEKILQRETKRIKFNCAIIIMNEFTSTQGERGGNGMPIGAK